MVLAKKSLGQNFLNDRSILQKILEAAELSHDDHVLEIGPGKGALTDELLAQAGKVTAVELDDRLIPLLRHEYGEKPNFELVHGDALHFTPPQGSYKIVANIPYYITSPLLNHYLMEQFLGGTPPTLIVFMVQKEVAEKIIAKKGKHSVLSLQVHLFGDVELVTVVPKTAFDPAPKVDSAVIKIRVGSAPKIDAELEKLFWLFKVSFAQKRKKLSNNLAAVYRVKPAEIQSRLEAIGISKDARAEDLNFEEWKRLYEDFRT